MQFRRQVLAASIALLAAAAPVLAAETAAPTFATKQVWLTCTGQQTKVYQVNWAAGIGNTSTYPTWDSTAPTGSVQSGDGCGGADLGWTTNPLYDVPMRGTFTGNLREVTVTVHQLVTHKLRTGAPETLRINGDVDGIPIFPPGTGKGTGRTVTVTPVASATGASEALKFTITNLGAVAADGTRSGLAYEDGDGAEQHILTLYVGVDGGAPPGTLGADYVRAFAWDTTDTPSGLVFNPAAPATAKVRADIPVFEAPEE